MGVRTSLIRCARRVLPRSVIALIEPRLSALPDRVGAILDPDKYAGMPPGPSDPLVIGDGTTRLVIGPLNVAGQAYHWARAVDALPDHAALSLVIESPGVFRFPAHRAVARARALGSRDWQSAEFERVVAQATHVLIESAHPLFGPLFRRDISREVRALQRAGVRPAIVAHGSDVRDIEAHRAREPHSPYANLELAPNHVRDTAVRRQVIERLGVPIFGSTPGVQFDLPSASWLPVVVDPDEWMIEQPPLRNARPVVVHAPSSSTLKGSEVADRVLGRMHREGVIEYRRLTGVPHREMPTAYASADIVVDSLRMGGYGVAACEAMAAGRLVVSHVNEHSRRTVRDLTGESPPIWAADAGTLELAIRAILVDRDAARILAERGPEFVRSVHDGRLSAAVLAPFLDS